MDQGYCPLLLMGFPEEAVWVMVGNSMLDLMGFGSNLAGFSLCYYEMEEPLRSPCIHLAVTV